MALSHFNPTFHFIAPKELEIPQEDTKSSWIKTISNTMSTQSLIQS